MRFLSSLPTLVFGISSTNVHRSGSHHRATRPVRYSRSSSGAAVAPSRSLTQTSGRSSQRGSGTPITATSATAGCPARAFSSSTLEIHSPPLLIPSFSRSLSSTHPDGWMTPRSPVRNQPSLNLSVVAAASTRK